MYWAPLLAYAFMKGQTFVGAQEYEGAAMPVSGTTVTWLDYPFQDFLEDGLVAVGCLVSAAGLQGGACSAPAWRCVFRFAREQPEAGSTEALGSLRS